MSELNKLRITKYDNALMQTILYSDVFDFPLKKKELWYFLKSSNKITKVNFLIAFKNLQKNILNIRGYYCLSNRSEIVAQRIGRKNVSERKYVIAKKAALVLSRIPTINFIGISGSLALGNARKDDDIDFFVITKKNTVWITRLVSLFILNILGLRRKRLSSGATNKICMNMFVDETALKLPKVRHDVYTAHEIAQLRPLVDKENTYNRFLLANKWVDMYMPNALRIALKESKKLGLLKNRPSFVFKISDALLYCIFANVVSENIAKFIQDRQIKKHVTNETISDSLLAFHPNDYRLVILQKYKERLKDKSFSDKLVFTDMLCYYDKMKQVGKFLSILFLIFSFLVPNSVHAQITPSPALDPGCIETDLGCVKSADPLYFVTQYYKFGLGIVGGFAVLLIIFGSYQILVSRGNPKLLNDGKTIIAYAISGLLLAIFGYLFIEVIAGDILKIPAFL